MVLAKFSLREVRRHPLRATLTLLGVAIGVAAAVAVLVCVKSTRAAYAQMFLATTGAADLEIVSEGGGHVDLRALPLAASSPGVRLAVPQIIKGASLWTVDPQAPQQADATVAGIDPTRDRQVRQWELAAGQDLMAAPRGVLLEESFAASLKLRVGDEIELFTPTGAQRYAVVGLLRLQGGSGLRGGATVFLTLAEAQRHWRMQGAAGNLLIVLDDGAEPRAVAADLQARLDALVADLNVLLPDGVSPYARLLAQRPADRSPFVDETLRAAETGLYLAAALALLVAFFIIFNTLMMNVSERRRHLAIMRAIGATRRQLQRMILGEALALGAAGAAVGLLLGLAGGALLARSMAQLFQSSLTASGATWDVLLAGVAVGLLTAVLGALWPVRQVGKLSPLEGMAGVSVEDRQRVPWVLPLTGYLLLFAAGATLYLSRQAHLPAEAAIPAALAVLVALVCFAPLLLGPACRAVGNVARPLLGAEGIIACRQLARRRLRTSLTVGVLFVAAATGTGMANNLLNNIADVRDWYQRLVVADFFVRARMPDFATGRGAEIPFEFGADLSRVHGIDAMDTLRTLNCTINGQNAVLLARQFTLGSDHAHIDLVEGEPRDVQHRLYAGEIVLASVLAERLGLRRGDLATLATQAGPRTFRVCGVTNDYFLGGMVLFMARPVAQQYFDVRGADYYLVRAKPGRRAEVELALRKLCHNHRLILQSYAQIARLVETTMSGVNAGLWAILSLGFLVSAFGIVNTLTMNVLEQSRELGLLRIVAMTRTQMRKTIFAQAALIGILGLLPGVAVGVALDRLVHASTAKAFGHPIQFQLHPLMLLASLAGGFAVVLAAGWLPAERAVRVNLLRAVNADL